MFDRDVNRRTLLQSMTEAFARGDGSSGESLLSHALDQGIPWDEVTSAAARGVSLRFGVAPSEGSGP